MEPKRFAYEEVEKILDAYAKEPARLKQYRRAYLKFKAMISVYACIDHAGGAKPNKLALSYAWEDAQMAFVGHGEAGLTGAVIQLWVHVPEKDRVSFKSMVEGAFSRAESATPPEVVRRYLARWRLKPLRHPDEGFTLPPILPLTGSPLSEWACDMGEDVDEVMMQFSWLAEVERYRAEIAGGEEQNRSEEGTGSKKARHRRLRLVLSKDDEEER